MSGLYFHTSLLTSTGTSHTIATMGVTLQGFECTLHGPYV
jgi:hypothetical protein